MFIVGALNELFRQNVDKVGGVKVMWYQTFIAFKTNHIHVLISRSFSSAKKPLYVCTSVSVSHSPQHDEVMDMHVHVSTVHSQTSN